MAGQISHLPQNKRLKKTGSEDTHGLPGDIITAAQIVFNDPLLAEIILRFVVEPGSPRWWTTRLLRVNYAFNQILMKTSTGKITLLMSLRGKKAQDDDEGRDVRERMTLRTMKQYLQYRRTYLPEMPVTHGTKIESNYIYHTRTAGSCGSFLFGHDFRFATWDPSLTTLTAYTDDRASQKEVEFYFSYTVEEGMSYQIETDYSTKCIISKVTEDSFYNRLQTYVSKRHTETLRTCTPVWFKDAATTKIEGLVAMMHHMVVG
jgi:hypothetical protein